MTIRHPSMTSSHTLLKAAGLGAALIGAAIAAPANAVPVAPNGKFSYSLPGPNSVDTGDISAATTSLTLAPDFLDEAHVTSFLDPYLGNPNNFCGSAENGCTAEHPPGFLFALDSRLEFTNHTLPVGNASPTPVSETVTVFTDFGLGGTIEVNFDFTSVLTSDLTPTTSTSVGSLTLDFTGTVASNSNGAYTLGQAAAMTITCTQASFEAAINCGGDISTPTAAPPVPEPASLALLSSAVAGLGLLRRRKAH